LVERTEEDEERHDDDPAADAEERAEEPGDEADPDEPHARILPEPVDDQSALARLASEPERAAILLDVDGTLAPIVERPEDARVPDETRGELERLRDRYALVACVSGRMSDDARRVVGVDGIVYIGSHGLELAPDAERYRGELHALADEVDWPIEDKRVTLSFHYRDVDDELAAVSRLERVAELAAERGLKSRWGRKVLEVLPPVDVHKGTAVRALLESRALRRALYAGDDATDLDAFAALDGLEAAVRVAVVSEEGPSDLGVAADLVVGSTDALLELLRRL
jgi:trehalose 6-phosphate phosphatase